MISYSVFVVEPGAAQVEKSGLGQDCPVVRSGLASLSLHCLWYPLCCHVDHQLPLLCHVLCLLQEQGEECLLPRGL